MLATKTDNDASKEGYQTQGKKKDARLDPAERTGDDARKDSHRATKAEKHIQEIAHEDASLSVSLKGGILSAADQRLYRCSVARWMRKHLAGFSVSIIQRFAQSSKHDYVEPKGVCLT